LVILFEEFIKDTPAVLQRICTFSGLPEFEFSPEPSHNISGRSRFPTLAYLADQLAGYKKAIHRVVPPSITHKAIQLFRKANVKKHHENMREETRRYLRDYFNESIRRTETLINRNLSHWK